MRARPQRIVVVGYGIAGLTATDALRAAGFDGSLTVVGAEPHRPYSRPALSKAALTEAGDMTAHELPEPVHGATEVLGVAASSLDVARRVVTLADGRELPYDGLVIASGSRAGRLADHLPVAHGVTEHVLRGLDDAVALRELVASKPSVVVVGGGPLGMEVASGCLAAGCEVTVVAHGRPLTRLLGPYLAEVFVAAGVERGLRIATSAAVRVDSHEGRPVVELADGSTVTADVLVGAVGDVPNTAWLADSGLLDAGVLTVDSRGRVRDDIVACGEVCAFPTPQGVRRIPLWTSAIEQAKVAAVALLEGDLAPELAFQPYFWTEQFGLNFKCVGVMPAAGDPEVVDGDAAARSALLRWQHDDGTASAAALNFRVPVPKLRRLAAPTA